MARTKVGGVIAAAGLLLLLAGCDNATSGTVTSRQHVPAYTAYDDMCVSYNQNGWCRINIPVPRDVPECWRVNFYNAKDDENGSACIDEADYRSYHLGDTYPRPAGPR